MSENIIAKVEEWRPVKEFEGLYSVSNLGRIRNDKIRDRFLLGCLNRDGYRKLCLRRNGKNVDLFLHRALLYAFHPPPNPGQNQCNHKNGNKDDNRLENIEWCSPSENRNHALDILNVKVARGNERPSAKLNPEKVILIRKLWERKVTIQKIGEQFGISPAYVSDIGYRKVWKHVRDE